MNNHKLIRTVIYKISKYKQQSGQTLIELILVMGLSSIFLPALLTGLIASREGKAQQNQRIQATALLREAEEASRNIREKGWTILPVGSVNPYHPEISGSSWSLIAGSEQINGFTRQIIISDVYRDTQGTIVDQANGTIDESTKKFTITVSWTYPNVSHVSSEFYLTRRENLTYTQTTQADFNAGTKTNTFVTNTNGGEVVLGAGGGGGDWCLPSLSITTVDLSRQGVPTAIAAYPGNIVTGTGGNASGPTFVKIKVTGNSPPTATIMGQFNNSKANGVFTEGNYGYIATTNNSEEIQILDLTQYSDPPTNTIFQKIGYFDAPLNTQGNSIYATSNVGYMSAGNKFYTFDLSSHTGSRPQLNPTAVTLAGTGTKILVVGNYAYVAVNSTTTQLQIIDITNPVSPSIVASVNTNNNKPGIDVAVNATGTRAYLVTSYVSATQPDFFIIDTTNKSGTLPIIGNGYNTGGMDPKGVAVATGNRAIIVGTGGTQQYQVLNITNETAITSCAGLAITNGANAVTTVLQPDGYAYAYVVTGDTHAELKMILGGAGGEFTSTGTFESATFNSGYKTAFNRFSATISKPPQTDVRFQVGVANAISGSCTGVTFTYLGPNGDPGLFFTSGSDPNIIEGAVPMVINGNYSNPGQCFRYKAYLSTTDSTATPVINDVTVNYSP